MRARGRLRGARRRRRSSAPTITSRRATRTRTSPTTPGRSIAALAARTTTLRLGTLVSPATFRAPGLLANAVATADHVSGGRIELGLGAGWMEREHRAFGFPFPETSRPDGAVRRAARDRPPALDGAARRLPRPPLRLRGRAVAAEAACSSPTRRSSSAAAAPAAPPTRPPASPTSTTRRSPRSTTSPQIRARVAAACERAGRDPQTMRFSVMTGCLIGATHAEALDRARELYGRAPARRRLRHLARRPTGAARSSARWTRSPPGYASTRRPAASA